MISVFRDTLPEPRMLMPTRTSVHVKQALPARTPSASGQLLRHSCKAHYYFLEYDGLSVCRLSFVALVLLAFPRLLLFAAETSEERRNTLTPLEAFLALHAGIFLLAMALSTILNASTLIGLFALAIVMVMNRYHLPHPSPPGSQHRILDILILPQQLLPVLSVHGNILLCSWSSHYET